MKKVLFLVMAVCLTGVFTACSQDEEVDQALTNATQAELVARVNAIADKYGLEWDENANVDSLVQTLTAEKVNEMEARLESLHSKGLTLNLDTTEATRFSWNTPRPSYSPGHYFFNIKAEDGSDVIAKGDYYIDSRYERADLYSLSFEVAGWRSFFKSVELEDQQLPHGCWRGSDLITFENIYATGSVLWRRMRLSIWIRVSPSYPTRSNSVSVNII